MMRAQTTSRVGRCLCDADAEEYLCLSATHLLLRHAYSDNYSFMTRREIVDLVCVLAAQGTSTMVIPSAGVPMRMK